MNILQNTFAIEHHNGAVISAGLENKEMFISEYRNKGNQMFGAKAIYAAIDHFVGAENIDSVAGVLAHRNRDAFW